MVNAPIPAYPSRRLVGLELEYDAGGTEWRRPDAVPDGWREKYDGSLLNGREYVLEPPKRLTEAKNLIEVFCQAFDAARTNTTKRGGFHVHVQSPEFGGGSETEIDNAYAIVMLYTHFQRVIDRLVGQSRRDNHYCKKFQRQVPRGEVVNMFNLESHADSRSTAKCSRSTMTVNLAMCRCRAVSHRSIEFRQGSPSKQFGCVWGWTVMLVALTDIATNRELSNKWLNLPANLENFVAMFREQEALVGASNVAEWVIWRDDYLNRAPTEAEIYRVVSTIRSAPRGLFHVSRHADLNLALTERSLDEAVRIGLISEIRVVAGGPKKWVAPYAAWAQHDLVQLTEALEALRSTSEVSDPPHPVSGVV